MIPRPLKALYAYINYYFMLCAHKSSHMYHYRLARLTGAFKIMLIYQISLEGYQIICVRSFHLQGPTSFRKYKPVNIESGSPKKNIADMELRNYPEP